MRRDLGALTARQHDLLVVGGGIQGAACAWDAAQRGLKVALVEARDFASGVSWNSLKTIHGGLRYLQTLDLARMRSSIRERSTLLRIAPELVRPLPFLIPTYGHGTKGREALGAAMLVNDLLSADRNRDLPAGQHLPPGRLLSPAEALELCPGLPAAGLSGAALYHDAQVQSSERLLIAMLRAAAEAGAALANHAEVTGLLVERGRVRGARVRDHAGGSELELRAELTLNATGPACDRLMGLAGLKRPPLPLLRAWNLVLSRPVTGPQAVGMRAGARFLFAVPWAGRGLIGTAYEPAGAGLPADSWRAFVGECAVAFPWTGLREEDVAVVHCGLVPGSGDAAGLARRSLVADHEDEDGLPGLMSVAAIKYTTARGLAERVVDRACARLARRTPPCRTATTPLPHARPLLGTLAERARAAARDEMALRLDDAVLRRLDLGTAGPPPAGELATVAAALAGELGWDAARQAAEVERLRGLYPAASPGLLR